MGLCGSDSSDSSGEVRFAPYLEDSHYLFLSSGGLISPSISFVSAFNNAVDASPYGSYEQIDVKDGFFGDSYEAINFPSLWDMFGKFMAGLDVHDLWGQVYEDVIQGPEIENAVSAQSALLQDEIDTTVMPRFITGMRDINSVQSTAFIIGKAIIQDAHVKSINKFASQIRIHAITMANDQWAKHLSWNEAVIKTYSEMFKLYYASTLDIDRANLEYQAKDLMWNINLFEPARALLGALSGSAATVSQNEPSQTQKAIGGAMSGAAAGAMVGGGYGALIGGVLGLAMSFL